MSGIFDRALEKLAHKLPEALLLAVVGSDGIPVARRVAGAQPRFETVTAEVIALAGIVAGAGTEGRVREFALVTEGATACLRSLGDGYFLLAVLLPGALVGRAKLALRIAAESLEAEFH